MVISYSGINNRLSVISAFLKVVYWEIIEKNPNKTNQCSLHTYIHAHWSVTTKNYSIFQQIKDTLVQTTEEIILGDFSSISFILLFLKIINF